MLHTDPNIVYFPSPCSSCGKNVYLLQNKFNKFISQGGDPNEFYLANRIIRTCCKKQLNCQPFVDFNAFTPSEVNNDNSIPRARMESSVRDIKQDLEKFSSNPNVPRIMETSSRLKPISSIGNVFKYGDSVHVKAPEMPGSYWEKEKEELKMEREKIISELEPAGEDILFDMESMDIEINKLTTIFNKNKDDTYLLHPHRVHLSTRLAVPVVVGEVDIGENTKTLRVTSTIPTM